ncbi:hypothetical protein [Streptomyces sp. NPDC052610]|uniref:hypothetical protein n=1 Tax=Streptomyces sp. NPDC052610 TaxID=3154952 RepID=UPI00341477F4
MAEPKRIDLKNGKVRWRVMVDAGLDENGKRVQITVTRDTKTECKAERDRILAARAAGTFIAPARSRWGSGWSSGCSTSGGTSRRRPSARTGSPWSTCTTASGTSGCRS